MISDLFHVGIYLPLYNALVFLISVVPFAEVGLAVILLTVLVKLVLFPLSIKAVRTQLMMREIEPELAILKEKYKDDKQEQARRMMALYSEKGVNPFSSFFLILIQIPIIFGLYWVFSKGGLPAVHLTDLYSFIPAPSDVNMNFLGFIDMGAKSAALAVLAGLTQFFQAKLSLPPQPARSDKSTFQEDFARGMHLQMRYVLPLIVVVASYAISSAVALYWTTSNIFAIGQELYVRKKIRPAQRGAGVVAKS